MHSSTKTNLARSFRTGVLSLFLLAAALLTSCGGGGGGNNDQANRPVIGLFVNPVGANQIAFADGTSIAADTPVTVIVDISDSGGELITSVTIQPGGQAQTQTFTPNVLRFSREVLLSLAVIRAGGPQTLTVTAVNESGRSTTRVATYIADDKLPMIEFSGVDEGELLTERRDIVLRVTDDMGLADVQITVLGETQSFPLQLGVLELIPEDLFLDPAITGPGNHTVVFTAVDSIGQESTYTLNFSAV